MKKQYLLLSILLAALALAGTLPRLMNKSVKTPVTSGFRDGDIIFQSSNSRQAMAIELATHSPYSHCGILFSEDSQWWVLEAVQPVSRCPLNDWIRRGKEQRYVVKRHKQAEKLLTPEVLKSMQDLARKWMGKNYDPVFNWSDANFYCSELVWKLYREGTGHQLGRLQQLRDLDLNAPQVQEIMYQRYGNHFPLGDTIITPVSIFQSTELKTVFADGRFL